MFSEGLKKSGDLIESFISTFINFFEWPVRNRTCMDFHFKFELLASFHESDMWLVKIKTETEQKVIDLSSKGLDRSYLPDILQFLNCL